MKSIIASLILSFTFVISVSAQMIDGDSTKYGNEWIDFNGDYFKIPVAVDGVYKITYQKLITAGIPADKMVGVDFQMHVYGQEVALYTSTENTFTTNDYILFYGEKNRGKIDKYLYEQQDKQLNPAYSLFTDTISYFLGFNPGKTNKRFAFLENDLSGNLPFVEEFYWHKEKQLNYAEHFKPTYNGSSKVTFSHLDMPEGFSSPMQQKNEFVLPSSNFIDIGENPILNVRIATSTSNHKTDISVNGRLVDIAYTTGYTVNDYSFELSRNDMQENMIFTFEGTDVSTVLVDRNSVPTLTLVYPRTFSFPNQAEILFEIEASLFPKYFDIPALDISGNALILFDLTNNYFLIPEINENNSINFVLPPSNKARQIKIFNTSTALKQIPTPEKIAFTDFREVDAEYVIVSNKDLFQDLNGINQVQAYADYRASDEGGNFSNIIVEIQQIIDQFGYGINRHSQALNNFANFINIYWSSPKYFFVIGKGRDYVETRTKEQLADPKNLFYVPTLGYHGSDVLMVAPKGLNSPGIPVGRIAVKTPEQIEEYLNKIKQHENYLKYSQKLEDKEWMKKVIHLSGGDSNIQDLLRGYLDDMGEILENNSFGANVVTYGRTSGTATEAVTNKIIEEINDGASLITFFGHSGVSNSDFNIGELDNDKFPLFLSLGCYSGDIHTNITTGQSEKFVLSPNGSIGFIGSAGTAYITPQYILGKEIYSLIGGEMYGKSIGEIIKTVLDINKNSTTISVKSLNQQLTLHGDPAIRINPHNGPDFLCDFKSVTTLPEVINSNEAEFTISMDIVNIGKWIDDSLSIRIIRKYPDNTQDSLYLKIPAPKYRSKIEISLPTGNTKGIGENCIYVELDYDNNFEEVEAPEAENNNELVDETGETGFCFYIINNGAKPIYPSEFSIVNTPEVVLKASTYNYFVDAQSYVFQIDTTALFNSTLLTEHRATYGGGLLEWQPNLIYEENRVYYWRISPDTLGTAIGFVWSNSSFVYLPNSSEGWNQSHLYQYMKDDFQGMELDGWNLDFEKMYYNITIHARKYDPDNPKTVFVNGSTWGSLNPTVFRPVINIVAWGPKRLVFNESGTDYGSIPNANNCFTFKTQTTEQRKGIKDLLDAIPDSTYVYIYTVLDDEFNGLNTETWAQDSISLGYNLYSVLESQGAKEIRQMDVKGTVPYIYIFQKGKGAIVELIGKDINDEIEVSFPTSINNESGKIYSTLIGPVNEWNKVLWSEKDQSTNDFSYLKAYKISKDLSENILIDSLHLNYDLDISAVDAKSYPYLKLEFNASDDKYDRDPPNLDFWRVLYKGLPDAVLMMDEYALFHKDTLDFGDEFRFRATAFNNSSIDMDSLVVKFTVKRSNNTEFSQIKKYKPLLALDTIHIGFEIFTDEYPDINEFTVELNPARDQVEQYYFNNIGIKRFYVGTDKENPLLDVTFDGVHIMDGDIISPKPEIHMMLRDENTFLALNNPSVFKKISLITPENETIEIPLNSEELEFIPAENTEENVARMIYRPELNLEGEYQLIVQARDISNNIAGDNEYMVRFRVILKEQISNLYNYPNPFSTSTQFVFTLTGYEIPDQLSIRIITLSGKVVREITREELGPIKIGDNITEYSWDGRDEYGEKLGNGVYLYQVIAKNIDGKNYSLMGNGENDKKFFKNGWGKLAILR